jgi:2-polyprenyl-6-methoxyphenol hydroxylase-like FAD-dependent oxidoreductase
MLGGQKGEGDLGFYASFKPAEAWAVDNGLDFSDPAQVLAWFTKEYSAWSPGWREILEQATMPVIPRRIYCMPLDQTWEALPNLTMMGDAAHVMPPFAGEGANMSMLDALELSKCLTSDKFSNVREAIAFYEVNMRTRAARAARQSLDNGARMHSPGALEKMLVF